MECYRACQTNGAHPRERGDDRPSDRTNPQVSGLIPASGETTPYRRTSPRRTSAHPRERGDDAVSAAYPASLTGSSPRAGRRRDRVDPVARLRGLIPASGETTSPRATALPRPAAHPRERGDDGAARDTPTGRQGSSPRAGRRRPRPCRSRAGAGLIPASGETTTCETPSSPPYAGSSPRAGRRLLHPVDEVVEGRLIPASGETTVNGTDPPFGTGAHPRERGDDGPGFDLDVSHGGSSPRAGRRLRADRCEGSQAGLIPASGETTTRTRRPG